MHYSLRVFFVAPEFNEIEEKQNMHACFLSAFNASKGASLYANGTLALRSKILSTLHFDEHNDMGKNVNNSLYQQQQQDLTHGRINVASFQIIKKSIND